MNSTDSKGYSPLLVAIEFGHYNLALSLLERGADISIGNQALCLPLHVAALTGCKNMIIPLLERGADINAVETVSIILKMIHGIPRSILSIFGEWFQ